MKNNNPTSSYFKKFLTIITAKTFLFLVSWFFIFLAIFMLVSLIGGGGYFGSKIKSIGIKILGYSGTVLLSIFLLIFSWKVFTDEKITKEIIGFFLIYLAITFLLEGLIFHQSYLAKIFDVFNDLFGFLGTSVINLFLILFGFWLILGKELFEIKFIKSNEIEVAETKEKTPIKGIKTVVQENKKQPTLEIKPKKIIQKSDWKFPSLDILTQKKEEVIAPDIKSTSQLIKKTFENFGINIEIGDVEIGPMATRFALRPAQGIKLSKILSLQGDLALALGVPNIRIETPIPGKSMLGLEVPNIKSAIVYLGNLVHDDKFIYGSNLTFALGRRINGEAVFVDLAKMPHLLTAGTTGSGKSMFIHSILVSLLLKNSPETLNLILIDPKRVELIHYQDLPHLLLDPILESKKAINAFQWLTEEMQRRYEILEKERVRDIDKYNEKVKEKIMPRIVLVIDELADLMVTYGSSIESYIVRLTQMARATGIHLILATQRPSVDVVTGLVKANIPNRICFKVASQIDSRTVLDFSGAEKLIGSGDALFVSSNLSRPIRVQTPFVEESEIEKIVNFWKKEADNVPGFEKQEINLDEVALKKLQENINEDMEDELLFKQALEIVLNEGKASTSLLQRRLKIGYGRAARILDIMEEKGIIGPQEGTKPRKVLVSKESLDEFLKND